MMKKMYDEGDDEMKRTIAKAWTEVRFSAQAVSSDNFPGLIFPPFTGVLIVQGQDKKNAGMPGF